MKLETGDKVYYKVEDFSAALKNFYATHDPSYKLECDLVEIVPGEDDEDDIYYVNVKIPRVALTGSKVIMPARRARR